MIEVLTLENIKETVKEIITEISKGEKESATILTLSGDLGAGKTTLTKELARQLGVKESVISPTFVIMKKYKTKSTIFKNLIHMDAYRLEKEEELENLGWEEISSDKNNLIIIEWPERVATHIPVDAYTIDLEHKDETTRTIKFCYNI